MAGDLSSERTRSKELAEKIAKRDPLDVNKVLYKARLCSYIVRNIYVTFMSLDSRTILWETFRYESAIRMYQVELKCICAEILLVLELKVIDDIYIDLFVFILFFYKSSPTLCRSTSTFGCLI